MNRGGIKAGAALGVVVAMLATGSATANVIRPDTRADEPGLDPDNGNCTLREAIESADRDVSEDGCRRGDGADVISLRRGTYELDVPTSETPGSTEIDNRGGDLDIGAFGLDRLGVVGHRHGTTIDANDHDRAFQIFGGLVTFERLTITDGTTVNSGGGVSVYAGTGRFVRTTVAGNMAGDTGGGVSVFGTTMLGVGKALFVKGTVRENFADSVGGGISAFGRIELAGTKVTANDGVVGGGIRLAPGVRADLTRARVAGNESVLTGGGVAVDTGSRLDVTASTIERNEAGTSGGGISLFNGELTMRSSTLALNRADAEGGGLASAGAPANPISLLIVNSTVSGNIADADGSGGAGEGGGLAVGAIGSKRIVSSTITRNRATRGGGFQGPFVTGNQPVRLKGTIVAGNTATIVGGTGPDCLAVTAESAASQGHNLFGDLNGCEVGEKPSDVVGNPRLGPLGRNGGPTKTHALRRGSRAIDKGPNDAPRRDQRGVRRDDPDIGAYERT